MSLRWMIGCLWLVFLTGCNESSLDSLLDTGYTGSFSLTIQQDGQLSQKMAQLETVVRQRLGVAGAEDAEIVVSGNRLTVTVTQPNSLASLPDWIGTHGGVGFWSVLEMNPDFYERFVKANDELALLGGWTPEAVDSLPEEPENNDSVDSAMDNSVGDITSIQEENQQDNAPETVEVDRRQFPLFARFRLSTYFNGGDFLLGEGAVLGSCIAEDQDTLLEMLNHPSVRMLFERKAKWAFNAIPIRQVTDNQVISELYLLETGHNNRPLLDQDVIQSAEVEVNPNDGNAEIALRFNDSGARLWEKITAEQTGQHIAITLGDRVISAPQVISAISGGRSNISGGFSYLEATMISYLMTTPPLPFEVQLSEVDYHPVN